MRILKMQGVLDFIGLSLSALCAVHCVLIPVAIIMFPVLSSGLFGDEGFHKLLLWAILPSSTLAFFLGCKRHKDFYVLALGVSGLCLLIITSILGHEILGEIREKVLVVLGGLIISLGHVRNFILCRHDECES